MSMTAEEREEIRRIKEKLDDLGGLPADVAGLRTSLEKLDDIVRGKQIDDAAGQAGHESRIETLEARAGGLSESLHAHVDEHWKWILSATGIIAIIIGMASWLSDRHAAPPAVPAPIVRHELRDARGERDRERGKFYRLPGETFKPEE